MNPFTNLNFIFLFLLVLTILHDLFAIFSKIFDTFLLALLTSVEVFSNLIFSKDTIAYIVSLSDRTLNNLSLDVVVHLYVYYISLKCSQLRILNGRFMGDFLGNFTCHKSYGASIVDNALRLGPH
jgi:hypothetical protein